MGREVKRVPLDFEWPVNKIWYGYLVNTCQDDSCDDCREFARIKKLPMTEYNCPIFGLDPPEGQGWQMWETVSDGSPISPVFETPEKLARWLADTNAPSFGYHTATYEQWLGMIKFGWAPSMAHDGERLMSGVEHIAKEATSND